MSNGTEANGPIGQPRREFIGAAGLAAMAVAFPGMAATERTPRPSGVVQPPAPGFAIIYYTVGGPVIPGEGLALLGSIDTNLDIFSQGSTEVTIGLAE